MKISVSIKSLPKRLTRRLFGIPFKIWILNFIYQRIFRINSNVSFQVHYTSQVVGNSIELGENVWKSFALSGNCYVQAGNGLIICDNTIFAPGVKLISANHEIENKKVWKKGDKLIIGKDCWIGTNAVILPEVNLGDNVIVGAGSVVTKSFGSNVVIAGNPAKIIKRKE